MALSTAPEWALRLPFCLMALLALDGVYLVASRLVSRRAAVFSVVVLATCPMFSLVARQAMTDMPFVGCMTLALALGILALFEEDEQRSAAPPMAPPQLAAPSACSTSASACSWSAACPSSSSTPPP